MGFTPCHHEPCLYVNNDYNGHKIYFLCQVDDFAVSAPAIDLAEQVISDINSKLTVDIRSLGVVNRFNGVDIAQTKKIIKVYNKTYIEKILKGKNWLEASIPG